MPRSDTPAPPSHAQRVPSYKPPSQRAKLEKPHASAPVAG